MLENLRRGYTCKLSSRLLRFYSLVLSFLYDFWKNCRRKPTREVDLLVTDYSDKGEAWNPSEFIDLTG